LFLVFDYYVDTLMKASDNVAIIEGILISISNQSTIKLDVKFRKIRFDIY
jgi:hypothetical protein